MKSNPPGIETLKASAEEAKIRKTKAVTKVPIP